MKLDEALHASEGTDMYVYNDAADIQLFFNETGVLCWTHYGSCGGEASDSMLALLRNGPKQDGWKLSETSQVGNRNG